MSDWEKELEAADAKVDSTSDELKKMPPKEKKDYLGRKKK